MCYAETPKTGVITYSVLVLEKRVVLKVKIYSYANVLIAVTISCMKETLFSKTSHHGGTLVLLHREFRQKRHFGVTWVRRRSSTHRDDSCQNWLTV